MRTPAPTLSLALLAALALAPRARADTATTLAAEFETLYQQLSGAEYSLMGRDRLAALVSYQAAMATAADLSTKVSDPGALADLGKLAAILQKKVAALVTTLAAGETVVQNPNVSDLKVEKSIEKAMKAGVNAQGIIHGLPVRGVAVTENPKGSAGFHSPGQSVIVRVIPGLDALGAPCTEAPAIAVIDPYGTGCVVPGYAPVKVDPDGTVWIAVTMGDNGGPARVQASACGVTRNLLLYNRGPTGTFAPKVSVDRFDGTYTGSYSGTFTVPGVGTQPVAGGVTLTVAGGTITVTAPSPGTGTVTASGGAGLAAAGGGANYKFSGKFTATSLGTGPGTAIAAGAWTATGGGGTGKGTWSVAR